MRDKHHQGNCTYTLKKGNITESAVVSLDDFDILIREPRLANIVKRVVNQAYNEGANFVDYFIRHTFWNTNKSGKE